MPCEGKLLYGDRVFGNDLRSFHSPPEGADETHSQHALSDASECVTTSCSAGLDTLSQDAESDESEVRGFSSPSGPIRLSFSQQLRQRLAASDAAQEIPIFTVSRKAVHEGVPCEAQEREKQVWETDATGEARASSSFSSPGRLSFFQQLRLAATDAEHALPATFSGNMLCADSDLRLTSGQQRIAESFFSLGHHVRTSSRHVARIIQLAEIGPGDVILDVGCGDCSLLLEILQAVPGCKGVGIEIDQQLCVEARSKLERSSVRDRLEILHGSAEQQMKQVCHLFSSVTVVYLYCLNLAANASVAHLLRKLVASGRHISIITHNFKLPYDFVSLAKQWPDADSYEEIWPDGSQALFFAYQNPCAAPKYWKIVGDREGGVIARDGCAIGSQKLPERLSTDTVVQEVELVNERLHFRRVFGQGPDEGWISTCLGFNSSYSERKVLARRMP